jgi:erythromycin esterase
VLSTNNPADWFRTYATELVSLDPEAPFDDLQPLAAMVAHARVVAVGESAHFVREFRQLRQRLLRFLHQRCGFRVFAFEFGFSEGFAIDAWVREGGHGAELEQVSPSALTWGAGELLNDLRRYNRTAAVPMGFAGIDIPEAGGTLLPALAPFAEYVREVDPDSVPQVESAMQIASRFAGASAASAAPAWARLEASVQDRLTATLARLRLRAHALGPLYVERSDRRRYAVALWRLEAAVRADYMMRATSAMFARAGTAGDSSVRELYMAETVRWHLDHGDTDTRIVLAAHNNHIQKTPVNYSGQLSVLPMGQHLARMLGRAYRAFAVTTTADHVPEMHLDNHAPAGFRVADAALEPPQPGSVEAALVASGLDERVSLIGFGPHADDTSGLDRLDRIRTQSTYMHTPILQAFDGVLAVPAVSVEVGLKL